MKLLILGGTVFLGRALVEAALARGHTVSIFTRGRTNPDLFPQVEHLVGNRLENLSALEGGAWDAVIDTSGYVPRAVSMAAQLLRDRTAHYTFISSVSAYASLSQPGIGEDAALGTLTDETVEEVNGETYGPLKVLCERTAKQEYGNQALIIRPGLIVGPHDPTDRFTYWPWRVAQGGEVLAPGRPERLVQFIDVRDLAEWNVRMSEAGQAGIYNATGPLPQPGMGGLLHTCKEVSGSDAQFVWVSDEFLVDKEVGPWMELPLWIPENDPDHGGMMQVDITLAVASGLTFRPLEDTVRDTLVWAQTRPNDRSWRAGGVQHREAELLRQWKEASRAT
jgi:2'-hydroxyisoflavone reductase